MWSQLIVGRPSPSESNGRASRDPPAGGHRRTRLKGGRHPGLLKASLVALVIASQTQARPVEATSAISQQANSNASAQLPLLSERANNLNSRYLSAGSTASLAASTAAAAANQSPQSGGQQSIGNAQQHSQHHHHNNQQQQHNNPQATSQQGQNAPVHPANVQQQQQQQQLQSPPQALTGSVPPVMASTYTYNPLTGQYATGGPSELGLGLANQLQAGPVGGFQSSLASFQQQQFVNPNGLNVGLQHPQQLANGNNLAFPYQTFGPSRQHQPAYQRPLSFPFGPSVSSPPPIGNQHFANQQRYQSAFTRRNGLAGAGLRPQGNYPSGGLDEDTPNGLSFQQQQQFQAASLSDQLAASLGFSLDPTYSSSSLPSPTNVYLQQQQNGLDLGSGGNVGLASSPTGGSPNGGLQFGPQDYQASGQQQQQQWHWQAQRGDSQQCAAADGRHGTCYQASECIRRGGTPMGRCASHATAQVNSLAAGHEQQHLSGSSHVCCLFDVTCGQFAAERFVYFRNPGYPTNSYDQSRMCRAKIGKLDKGVCQFRLDMLRFDIAKPTNGNCSQDMFVVSGQNENYVIPKICGFNDGQHYYVGVDESGVITLHMMMMGYYRRSFEILITQLPCRSDFAAPAHCLQYFIGTHGTIKSFNYDAPDGLAEVAAGYQPAAGASQAFQLANGQAPPSSFVNYDLQQDGSSAPYGLQIQQRQQPLLTAAAMVQHTHRYAAAAGPPDSLGGYPNDLDYTICIRKESGFCSITYQLSRGDHQGGGLSPFAVGHHELAGGGHNDTSGWQSSTAAALSSDCRDDYLLVGGVRLCSAGSNTFYDPYGQGAGGNASYLQQQQVLLQQQTQQLQAQQALLMQQLARLNQQQQQSLSGQGQNVSSLANAGNPLLSGQQQQPLTGNNLEQQQAAVVQQLMLLQQQLNSGLSQQAPLGGPANDLGQGTVITDTTSGPFLLRFVSNNARNARGFHLDYRQNPCK